MDNTSESSLCAKPDSSQEQTPSWITYSPAAMLQFDRCFKVLEINDAMSDVLGRTLGDEVTVKQLIPDAEAAIDQLAKDDISIDSLKVTLSNSKFSSACLFVWQIQQDRFALLILPETKTQTTSPEEKDDKSNVALRAEIASQELDKQVLRGQAFRQKELARLTGIALDSENLKELCDSSVQSLNDLLNADTCFVAGYSDKTHSLTTTAQAGGKEIKSPLSVESLKSDLAAQTPLILVTKFSDELTSAINNSTGSDPETILFLEIPSTGGERNLIAIVSSRYRQFSDDETVWAQAIAHIIGVAMKKKQIADKLEETTIELRRSNEDLQQFAYAAAHDLQEPLRSIVSYLDLLNERYWSDLDDTAQRYITTTINAAKRMQALITDLLEYSRVSTHGQSMERTDFNKVITHVIGNLKASIEESKAQITFQSLPTLTADSSQMVQLFQNLLSNAIKFRSEYPLEIDISAERQQSKWVFTVQDNGIGLEMQYANRVFIIFQRLHSRTKFSGTGIGLALCKKIVERHDGRIWVESDAGKGSKFMFTLPA